MFSLGLAILMFLVPSALAQSNQAGIIFQAESNKTVSRVVEEIATIQNNGSTTLDSGSLEIIFPSQVQLQSANPGNYQYDNSKAVWSMALAPQSSLEIRYVLMPVASGQDLVTKVKFSVNGQTLAETQAVSNIGSEVQGAVETAPTQGAQLPRTGMDLNFFLVLFVPLLIISLFILDTRKS